MTEQEYHRWKELFYKKEEKFFEMLAGEQEKEGLILSLYVRFATDLYKAYVEKEIPDEVYDARFYNLVSTLCKRKKKDRTLRGAVAETSFENEIIPAWKTSV